MFSIIIPVFNVAPYLRECLESVLAQTCADWECICVDDGSTDGSGDILDEYAVKDGRFKVIHQQNAGVSAARNTALGKVIGEWVLFVDADDVIGCESLTAILRGRDVYPDAQLITLGLKPFLDGDGFESGQIGEVSAVDVSKHVSAEMLNLGFCQAAYASTLIADMKFLPFAYGEDLVWWCECLARAKSVVKVDYCAYGYRQRSGSAMTKPPTPDGAVKLLKVRELMFTAFQSANKTIAPSFARGYGNAWTERVPYYIFSHRKDPTWESVWTLWVTSLSKARRITVLTLWIRFVAFVVSITKSKLIVLILCVMPYVLKKKGFHR